MNLDVELESLRQVRTSTPVAQKIRSRLASRRRRRLVGGVAMLLVAVLLTTLVIRSDDAVDVDAVSPVAPARAGDDPGDENPPLTEPVVVATGTLADLEWQLVVYDSESGLCVDLRLPDGAAGGCGHGVPDQVTVGVGLTARAGVHAIFGPVTQLAERVVIELIGGGGHRDDSRWPGSGSRYQLLRRRGPS